MTSGTGPTPSSPLLPSPWHRRPARVSAAIMGAAAILPADPSRSSCITDVIPRRGGWAPWLALLALLALVGPQPGCTQKTGKPPAPGVPVVRVRVLAAQAQVTVAASHSVAIRQAPGVSPRPLGVPRKQDVLVRRTPSGWQVGGLSVDAPAELTFLPVGEGGFLSVNGKPYRGDFRLVPVAAGRFDVVNHVDIDGYLKGVLARELLADWHAEAYRAQAIVARTYALYELKTAGGGRHWDLHPDVRSQVYDGLAAETPKSRSAVDATAGVVVAAGEKGKERIFKAYFSACCGGISQSATDAFDDPPSKVLSDRSVGARCNISPRFNWGPVVIRKDELTRRLRAWGAVRDRPEKDIAPLAQIDIASANAFGRPVRFILTDATGERYHMIGTELRSAINTDAAPGTTVHSSFFTPFAEDTQIRFVDGHGSGHGVGLCQWCAQAQATERAARHEDIVVEAYPGSSLQRAY